jgi:malate/lactate dehydrogenase
MLERRAEEFSLAKRPDTGNNNDHSRMQRFLSMENKKVGTIVRDKRVILGADGGHELPVFRTAETEIVDMIGYVTSSMCQFNQRSV